MSKKSEIKDNLKDLSIKQLQDKVVEFKKELMTLRFRKVNNDLQNTARYRIVKRDIARILTIINEKKLKEAKGA
ncbi:MAG: 50S ribosomal protein L29 [Sphingobacteriia bacterium]|nr:50S ribosomal protein L29 [Sphingobacteriia bacterium]